MHSTVSVSTHYEHTVVEAGQPNINQEEVGVEFPAKGLTDSRDIGGRGRGRIRHATASRMVVPNSGYFWIL